LERALERQARLSSMVYFLGSSDDWRTWVDLLFHSGRPTNHPDCVDQRLITLTLLFRPSSLSHLCWLVDTPSGSHFRLPSKCWLGQRPTWAAGGKRLLSSIRGIHHLPLIVPHSMADMQSRRLSNDTCADEEASDLAQASHHSIFWTDRDGLSRYVWMARNQFS
jgi:hypothetical protein